MVIPTGIGASVGGYGGDATVHMNLVASVCDVLITHPNVANAAGFQKLPPNTLYVEGYGLDQFVSGRWGLAPVRANRVGLVLDAGMEPAMRTLHLNTLAAVQTVYGVDVAGMATTQEPLSVECGWSPAGTSWGRLSNPEVLLEAVDRVIDQGASAVALAVQMPPMSGEEDYGSGQGVDPVGGIEAILSHYVVSQRGVPCAHAPVFAQAQAMPEWETLVDPRAASEYITSTFLPCILTGLARAPQFVPLAERSAGRTTNQPVFTVSDLDAVVLPADALGGIPALSAMARGIPILAVSENRTVMAMDTAALTALGSWPPQARVIPVATYLEAVGVLQAMRLGLTLPQGRVVSNLPLAEGRIESVGVR
jgi:hypothetical protein